MNHQVPESVELFFSLCLSSTYAMCLILSYSSSYPSYASVMTQMWKTAFFFSDARGDAYLKT